MWNRQCLSEGRGKTRKQTHTKFHTRNCRVTNAESRVYLFTGKLPHSRPSIAHRDYAPCSLSTANIVKNYQKRKKLNTMEGEFKKCPNGHYYQGTECPYCRKTFDTSTVEVGETKKTEIFRGEDTTPTDPNIDMPTVNVGEEGQERTIIVNGPRGYVGQTVFGEPTEFGEDGSVRGYRKGRKLVGWLVTYTGDVSGMDFKLYEGRNIIGRNVAECNIVINDARISNIHAVILYRAGKYSIKDNQSSHGTFVNGEDIELDARYLQDGDIIKIGGTTLKFRSSL